MITSSQLKLEIGSEAFNNLTSDEVNAICSNVDSVVFGAMKAFELLWKKFKPTYRLGKMYKAESDRYKAYYEMFCWYTRQVKAGYCNKSSESVDIAKWRSKLE